MLVINRMLKFVFKILFKVALILIPILFIISTILIYSCGGGGGNSWKLPLNKNNFFFGIDNKMKISDSVSSNSLTDTQLKTVLDTIITENRQNSIDNLNFENTSKICLSDTGNIIKTELSETVFTKLQETVLDIIYKKTSINYDIVECKFIDFNFAINNKSLKKTIKKYDTEELAAHAAVIKYIESGGGGMLEGIYYQITLAIILHDPGYPVGYQIILTLLVSHPLEKNMEDNIKEQIISIVLHRYQNQMENQQQINKGGGYNLGSIQSGDILNSNIEDATIILSDYQWIGTIVTSDFPNNKLSNNSKNNFLPVERLFPEGGLTNMDKGYYRVNNLRDTQILNPNTDILMINEKNDDTFQNDIEKESQCFNLEGDILFAHKRKEDCVSVGGVWDKPCDRDEECPFWNSNISYPKGMLRGGCVGSENWKNRLKISNKEKLEKKIDTITQKIKKLETSSSSENLSEISILNKELDNLKIQTNINLDNNNLNSSKKGFCELPRNMKRVGYKHFLKKKGAEPLCYQCKFFGDYNYNLDSCCSEQAKISTPDYAFLDDTKDRLEANMFSNYV